MNIEELIKKFVNIIGYDGDEYMKLYKSPYIKIVDSMKDRLGKYVSISLENDDAEDEIEKLQLEKLSNEEKDFIKERGCIILSKESASQKEKMVTIIHEMLHSNRNMIIKNYIDDDYICLGKKDNSGQVSNYFFRQYDFLDEYIGDIGQSVLKLKYDEEIKKIGTDSLKHVDVYDNFEYIKNVDEALIELMAQLIYNLCKNPEESLKEKISKISEISIDNNTPMEVTRVVYMAKIIKEHDDYELFKWMINPIDYCIGDIRYDYFGEYTKNDDIKYLEKFNSESSYVDELSKILKLRI